MTMFAGMDVAGKRSAVCILDDAGKVVWRGMADTHPEMIDAVLRRFKGELTKVGLESGPFTPRLFRSLAAMGYPMICIDARRAADAIKSRREWEKAGGQAARWNAPDFNRPSNTAALA